MSIPKEPRQLMINLMYLVLIAMLALNVSSKVINAFGTLKEGMDSSIEPVTKKTEQLMASLEKKVADQEKDADLYLAQSKKVRAVAAEFNTYLDTIIRRLGQDFPGDTASAYQVGHPEWPKNYKNTDKTTRVMVGEADGMGAGDELKLKIEEARKKFAAAVESEEDKTYVEANIPLKKPKVKIDPKTGEEIPWARKNYEKVPVIGAIALLTKLKADVANSESTIIERLYSNIGKFEVKPDRFGAKVVAPASYLLTGGKYEADIFVSAYSSQQQPEIYMGSVQWSKFKEDEFGDWEALETSAEDMPISGARKLDVKGGKAVYSTTAGSPGKKNYQGIARIAKPGGTYLNFPFKAEYEVGSPAAGATVSADKMNVFYIGVDNPVTVSGGTDASKTNATMTGGTMTPNGKNKYNVRVSSPGTAKITVSYRDMEGNNKTDGPFDFRVKKIPDPTPQIGGKSGGAMKSGTFKAQRGVIAKLDNFDFEARFDVIGFEMTYAQKRADLQTATNQGGTFSGKIKTYMSKAKPGDIYYFDKIKARGPDGTTRTLPTVAIKVI